MSIRTISEQLKSEAIQCVVVFDMSTDRIEGQPASEQRARKVKALQEMRVRSFYYESHAPFLFATRTERALRKLKRLLINAGMPKERLMQ